MGTGEEELVVGGFQGLPKMLGGHQGSPEVVQYWGRDPILHVRELGCPRTRLLGPRGDGTWARVKRSWWLMPLRTQWLQNFIPWIQKRYNVDEGEDDLTSPMGLVAARCSSLVPDEV